jgi:predicted TPR repeat methyltransferase
MTENTLNKAQALIREGAFDQALTLIEALLKEDPKQPECLHQVSLLFCRRGQFKQATTTIQQAIKLDPTAAHYQQTLGLIHLHQKHYADAQAALFCALELDNQQPTIHNNLANCFIASGQPEKALEHYQLAIQLAPQYWDAYYNLGLCYMRLEKHHLAKEAFEQVLRGSPKHPGAHGNLGQLLLKEEQYTAAGEQFKARLELQPQHADSWHDLGLCHIKEQQYSAAIDALNQALTLAPQLCDTHYHLGIAYLHSQSYEKALEHFLLQLKIAPYYECYFNIGVLLMYEGRLIEASEYLNEALKLQPDSFEVMQNLAVTHLKGKEISKACHYYQQALKLQPNNTEIKHILTALNQDPQVATQAPREYLERLFDQYAPYYDYHLQERLRYHVPNSMKDKLASETHLHDNQWPILDLGCGTGLVAELLKPYSSQLVGIDCSQQMIAIARQKKLYDELITDELVIAMPSLGSFEFITAADVFTYIGDLSDVLTHSVEHLNSGGYLCFSVEVQYECESYKLLPSIRYAHHPDYLTQLADQVGMQVIDQNNIELRKDREGHISGLLCLWQKP